MFGSDKKKGDSGGTSVEPAYGPGDVEKADALRTYGADGMHVGGMTGTNALNDRGEIEGGVKRQLKPRHMAMIAIGGSIGTGLFVGSGEALSTGGPVGIWLAYCLMGSMVYGMMVALGEMATLFPVAGAFTHYASRFVDPALGFATGFNYWYSWAITLPTELVAVAIIVAYWDQDTNPAVWITVFMVVIWIVNFFGARAYGETEFWLSTIKVITIVGLIILGLVLMCGGGPNRDPIGFRYWRNPGPFNQITINDGEGKIGGHWGQFLAFWSVFVQAAFSFIGTEILGTTLGEAQNPRKAVPKAIRRVFFRILMFYVLGIFFISVLVPYNHPRLLGGSGDASSSPWVIAIDNAGIKVLPHIVNAVILSAAFSAGISDVYAASRTFYALALEGQMPRIFRKCTKRGLPLPAILVTCAFGPLAYLNTGGEKAQEAFNWLYNLAAIAGIGTWWTILISYLRFYYGMKKQGLSRDDLPYKAPFMPYLAWYSIIWFSLILFFNGFPVFLKGNWDTSSFFASYISIPIFIGSYVVWKLVKKTKTVKLADIDFTTGRRELDAMEQEDEDTYRPETWWQRVLAALF